MQVFHSPKPYGAGDTFEDANGDYVFFLHPKDERFIAFGGVQQRLYLFAANEQVAH